MKYLHSSSTEEQTADQAKQTNFVRVFTQYGGRKDWVHDKKFLKDLEDDSINTEDLDEELQEIESSESHTWQAKLEKLMNSTPFQIAMFLLAVIDVVVVVGEILLDLNAVKAEAEESQSDLNLALNFLKDTYSSELMGYKGIDVNYMLDVIHLSQAPSKSNHFNTTARRKRDVDSLNLYRHLFKRYVDSFINTTQQSNSTNNHTDYYISPTFPPTTTTSYNNRTLPPVPESQGSMADYLLEIAQIFHIISIVVLGIFVLQVFLKLASLGAKFFRKKMEIIDSFVVITSFALDIVLVKGIISESVGEQARGAIIVVLLLWQIVRIFNGIMLTSMKRQDFRIKLQKRARRKLEKQLEAVNDEKHLYEKEVDNLKHLCESKGATEEELSICKPRIRYQKLTTSSGLSSIASLSVGLSLNGPLIMHTQQLQSNMVVLPRSRKTSIMGGHRSAHSSVGSLSQMDNGWSMRRARSDLNRPDDTSTDSSSHGHLNATFIQPDITTVSATVI